MGIYSFEMGAIPMEVVVCFTAPQLQTALRQRKAEYPDCGLTVNGTATTHFFNAPNGRLLTAIAMCGKAVSHLGPVEIAGLLTHEAVHVMQECRRWMRESEPGAEWEAYTVQYVAQHAMMAWCGHVARGSL
ncbi:hypothetical protein ACOTEH_30705 [Achromobacter xylosoxidans]